MPVTAEMIEAAKKRKADMMATESSSNGVASSSPQQGQTANAGTQLTVPSASAPAGNPSGTPAAASNGVPNSAPIALPSVPIHFIRVIGSDFTTHGDLSCISSNPVLVDAGFRGPRGHDANFSPIANGVPVALVK